MRKFLLPLPALLIASAAVVAQAPPPPPPPVGAVPAAPQAYRAKQVLGARVNIQDNQSVGTVDDIVFDETGNIEYLIVADAGKLVSIPWQAAKFNFTTAAAAPIAVVNITREQYRTVPTFTVRTYPNFYAPAYRTEVYKFYGLTPGQARRLDRQIDRR